MKITLHHMSPESAWKLILREYSGYHDHLKHYGYTYKPFVPDDKKMNEMFEQETLSQEQIKYYRDIFINEVYNVADLSVQDENINKALPHFQELIEKHIKPLLKAWGVKLPESLAIQCNYGYGAGYIEGNNAIINLRVSNSKKNDYGIYLTLAHEFVHILIEHSIIQKYNVPQDLKESIVEIIGFELFDKKHTLERFANSFVNAYITSEAIKTDLPGAVKKMMADYTILQQKQAQAKFLAQVL